MAKTNDFQICQKYLDNYINTIKKEIDTCHIQLNNQAQSYPLTTLSLDQLDHYLKEFVDCQRKYLSMRNKEFIAPTIYSPLNNDQKMIEVRNKRYKTIQEAKRIWLNVFLNAYEVQLQEYDQQYENEFLQLESHLLSNININGSCVYQQIQQHMNYQTNKLKKQVSMKIRSLRGILIKNRRRSSSAKNTAGPSCIRINQSAIRHRHQQEIAIQKDHQSIYDKVRSHLNEHYFVPMTATILKQYSNQLLHDLNLSYFSPLSYNDQTLALKQARKVVSIQRKIKKHHLILRVTDKGYNFYIGTEKEFDKKAQNVFQDTHAFIELKENPFNKIQDNVIHLLNQIRAKNFIFQWQCYKMMPDRIKCQLAHLYFNPKTHKV
ncbi:unnamed protein product [Rotaria socialis]